MDTTDEIKARLDIVDYIGRVVKLKRTGRNFTGLCPFHQEKSPSFFVSPDRQSWHCFGCSRGGDVFAFVMEHDGLDFKDALSLLADETGVKIKSLPGRSNTSTSDQLLNLLKLAEEFFRSELSKSKIAQDYITQKRQINNITVNEFRLGFAPDAWNALGDHLTKQGFTIKEMVTGGVTIEKENGGGYDRFRNRIIFPIHDTLGRTIGFAGRSIDPNEQGAKYINSPETPIFKKSEVLFGIDLAREMMINRKYAIIVEGPLDVISLHQIGIKNVIAPQGSAFTPQQLKLIKRFTDRIILLYDQDGAGQKAALRTLEICLTGGTEVKIAKLTTGKDPDEAAHKNPKHVATDLKNTQDFYNYLYETAEQTTTKTDPHRIVKISNFILPFLRVLPNISQQESLVNRLAETLRVNTEGLFAQMSHLPYQSVVDQKPETVITVKPDKENIVWQEFCALLLQLPKSLEKDAQVMDAIKPIMQMENTGVVQSLGVKLAKTYIEKGLINQNEINANLTPEEHALADVLILKDIGDVVDDEETFTINLEIIVKGLRKQKVKNELNRLGSKDKSDEPEWNTKVKALLDERRMLDT